MNAEKTVPTLGELAEQTEAWKDDGVTRASLDYAAGQVWWDDESPRIFASRVPVAVPRNPVSRALLYVREGWSAHTPKTRPVMLRIHMRMFEMHLREHAGQEGYLRLTPDTVAMILHAQRVLTRLSALIESEEPS